MALSGTDLSASCAGGLLMKKITVVQAGVSLALQYLEEAMQVKPGPYPDPECPIEKWQAAHEHLLAAQLLLEQ